VFPCVSFCYTVFLCVCVLSISQHFATCCNMLEPVASSCNMCVMWHTRRSAKTARQCRTCMCCICVCVQVLGELWW